MYRSNFYFCLLGRLSPTLVTIFTAAISQEDVDLGDETDPADYQHGFAVARKNLLKSFERAYADLVERPFREVLFHQFSIFILYFMLFIQLSFMLDLSLFILIDIVLFIKISNFPAIKLVLDLLYIDDIHSDGCFLNVMSSDITAWAATTIKAHSPPTLFVIYNAIFIYILVWRCCSRQLISSCTAIEWSPWCWPTTCGRPLCSLSNVVKGLVQTKKRKRNSCVNVNIC